MHDTIAAVILAAGQGTRMKSSTPKVLHQVGGKPMIRYSLEIAKSICTILPVVVIGHGSEQLQAALKDDARFALQEKQLGTAHAVQQSEPFLSENSDLVIVLYGDMPLLTTETVSQLVEIQQASAGPMTMLTVISDDPRGFGRVIRAADGCVEAIVEEAQASPEQLLVKELNVGVYCFKSSWLWDTLKKIEKSPKGEYYLTDTVALAVAEGLKVQAGSLQDAAEAIGINNRVHLAEAEAVMRSRNNRYWMLAGVTIIDPPSTYIDSDVQIGQDTIIYPNTIIKAGTVIGRNCRIGPNSVIDHTIIGDDCLVLASVMEKAVLENHVEIGPFGHLRKGAHLADYVHMGNFGEVKNSYLGPHSKMGHFSYIGDAKIGENVNIGAGTITCNYDGKLKHPTEIGDDVFIGSDTMLVAPLKIGKGAQTGAGSVVTHDVEPGSTVVGVPARKLDKKENRG